MKTFDELWVELLEKSKTQDLNSNSVKLMNAGIHQIGKKILEEAGEVWIAAEYQTDEELATEISQLIYHIQLLALARGLTLDDIYKEL